MTGQTTGTVEPRAVGGGFVDDPVLIEATRSGRVESVHRGALVLLEADGSYRSLGQAQAAVFPRSSLKPLQAAAMVRAGLDLPERLLAIVGASHDGTQEQVQVVRDVLASAGLDEEALNCPPDLPELRPVLVDYLRGGGDEDRVHHNCSGKHAGMVATCVVNDWPLQGYLDPEHPLQQSILAEVEALAGEVVAGSGVDGCGAPVYAFSLLGLARSFAAMTTAAPGTAERRVADAMRAHPHLVGGPGRDVSELMAGTPGLLAKDGAEAVWAAALPDGRAMAAKLDDGALRALPPLLAAVLEAWGCSSAATAKWIAVPVLGHGRPVGELQPSPELRAWLGAP